MPTVQEVKQKLTTARQQISARRAEARASKEQIQQTKTKLPDVGSQRALKDKYSGMQGRVQRRKIADIKKSLATKERQIRDYESELTRYEETQLKPVESSIQQYEREKGAYRQAKEIFLNNRYTATASGGIIGVSDPIVKKYLTEFVRQGEIAASTSQYYTELGEKVNLSGVESLDTFEKGRLDVGLRKEYLGFEEQKVDAPESLEMDKLSVKVDDRTTKKRDFSPFQMVGATTLTDPKGLKDSTTFDKDGVTNVLSGVSDRVSGRDSSKLGTRIINFLGGTSDLKTGRSEGFEKTQIKETYDPGLGFVSPTYAPGEGGTVTIRAPTIKDIPYIAKVEKAQFKGSLFSKPVPQIVEESQQFRQLTKNLDKLEGKELDVRLQNIRSMGGTIDETQDVLTGKTTYDVRSPTIGVGFGMNKRQIPIDKLDTKTQTGLYFSGVREQYVKRPVKKGAEFIGYPEEITIPEKTKRIYEPQFGTIQYDPITGKEISGYKDLTIPERTISPSGIVGEVASAGTYFVPYVFGAEVVGKYGELTSKEDSYIKGGISFVKKYPVETAIVGTLGAVKLGTGISRIVPKSKFGGLKKTQYGKALETAEKELTSLEKEPVRWLSIQEKGTKRIELKGYQDTPTFGREIRISGRTQKTEKGFEFIPETKGTSVVGGKMKVGKKDVSYFGTQTFETGSKSTMIPKGSVGDVKFYYQVGVSGSRPKASSFIIAKPKRIAKYLTKPEKMEKQFQENIVLGGDEVKEISDAGVFKLKENVYFTVEPERGLGLTLIKDAPTVDKVRVLTGGGKKTPLTTTFQAEKPLSLATVKPAVPKIQKPSTTVMDIKPAENLPSMVGGTGLKLERSPYAGTGTYERQEAITFQTTPPRNIQIETQRTLVDTKQTITQQPITKTKVSLREDTILKTQTIPKFKEQTKIRTQQKEIPKERFSLRLNQLAKQAMIQKQQLKTTQRPRPTKTTTKTTTPKIKIPIKLPGLLSRLAKKVDEGGLYESVGFQFGKEKVVAKGTIAGTAKELKSFLKGGLSASGFVREIKTGKKVKAAKLLRDFGEEFRVSKVDPFKVVEKQPQRLRPGATATGKQIQMFRPKGKKSKKKSKKKSTSLLEGL